jgi:hypothetical protein
VAPFGGTLIGLIFLTPLVVLRWARPPALLAAR